MNKELSTYPKELTEMRSLHEMSFIMSLWKNPELYDEYINEVNPSTDLLLQDGKFYYTLGLDMHKLGYKSFDDASIFTYMNSNDELVEEFSKRGGIREVDNMRAILNEENIETYYDNLVKNNMLIKLYDKGFDVVKEIDKFNIMTTTQLYDYFEYQLDNVFLNRGAGVKIEDLSIDKDFIDSCNEGTERGFSYGSTCPILNYHTLGLHKANVQVFAGFSGTGKSSFVMNSYVMPILDGGEKIVIVANEMNISAWKHLFLATILSSKLKYFGVSRKKQKTGGFTQEQYEWLMKAVDYYNEHYKDRIKFVKIYDYSIEDVKRVFRKMSKLGFSYGLFDTFKSENSASERVTGELIEASKQLLQVAEKEEMCIIITMQLAIHMENTRYLTGATLSTAKGVKEVVSELILMRKLWDDEFKDEKYDVKPYRLRRDPATGKITNVKEEITLDRDKKYRILFLDKTRNDEDDLAILFQFDGAWNSWKEIGYCSPRYQRN